MSGFRKAFKLVRRAPREKQIKLDPTHILETLPIAVVVVDEQDVISDVNYAAEEFFGASKNILLQSNLGELLPVDHPVFLMMERARSAGVTIAEHDLTLEGPRMTRRGCAVLAAPVLDYPGYVMLTFQDESAAKALG
ncbi:MAG TPA: PAS domain-containing protein, partial [Acidocella sp.]|nr:PAS domain-containing protein [Acidocella sp.]